MLFSLVSEGISNAAAHHLSVGEKLLNSSPSGFVSTKMMQIRLAHVTGAREAGGHSVMFGGPWLSLRKYLRASCYTYFSTGTGIAARDERLLAVGREHRILNQEAAVAAGMVHDEDLCRAVRRASRIERSPSSEGYRTSSLLLSSLQTNDLGTAGGRDAPFTPTLMPVMPVDCRRGMAARDRPGTSRWLRVAGGGTETLEAMLRDMFTAATKSSGVIVSGSALWGKAFMMRSPSASACLTMDWAEALGQCRPKPSGQLKKRERLQMRVRSRRKRLQGA